MKIYISNETGNYYWLEGEVLMACPIRNNKFNGVVNMRNEGCEVDWLNDEEYYHKVKEELSY